MPNEKESVIEAIIGKINRDYQKRSGDSEPIIKKAGDWQEFLSPPPLPTGIAPLDKALEGGLPRKTMVSIYGRPGAGKTTLACFAIASVQKEGGTAMFINTATRFPSESMRLAGVDTSRLFYLDSASYGDDLLTHARELLYDKEKGCARNIVDILVIDDVTGLVPKSEVEAVDEEGFEKATVGRHAALLSKFLRHVAGLGCLRHGGNLILCNQERLDVGSYGNPRKQTGGLAMEFWPRVILQLSKKPITSGSDKKAIGQEVHFTCDKLMFRRFDNPPEGSYRVIYGQGVDQSVEAVEEALDLGIIKKISVSDYELYNTEGKLLRLSKIESVRKYYQTQWEEQVALLDQIYALKGAASKPIIAAPLSAPKEAEPLTVMEAALLSETTPPKPKKK